VVHGEAAATLGALSLITRAYALLWKAAGSSPRAAALVGECLGVSGILDGQARDVHFRREAGVAEIVEVEAAKTVPLVRLALVLPAVVAGEGPETLDRLERLASAWGLAYQILDDFKDRLMGPEESGKTAGRDDGLGRPSLPALAGPRRALARLRRLLSESRSIVDSLAGEAGGRWAPLESLQAFLEEEAGEVPLRLEREAA
jgi:geranylgeranyl pyrophosphate synthase